ncbi:MAG: ester cyclase [Candidatus Bathyarchaeia archaeon]
MDLPPKKYPDSYWANKRTLDNDDEISEWALHDFNNWNSYPFEKYKAWLQSCRHLFADDFEMITPGGVIKGYDSYIALIEMYFRAFSELHIEVIDFFVKGNMLAVHYVLSGKHTGEFMGNPPTNKIFNMRAVEIFRFENGKYSKGVSMSDTLSFMQQLGIM